MSNDELLVWTAFARWLGDCGFHVEVREGLELQRRLFAIPAHGTRLPWRGCPWLPWVGFPEREPRPSPVVAYRLNAIHDRLLRQPWPAMNELLALVSAEPGKVRTLRVVPAVPAAGFPAHDVTPAFWLRDALAQLGIQWSTDLIYVDDVVTRMLEDGTDWRQVARLLGRELRKLNICVDAEQIVWTAISRARSRAAWDFMTTSGRRAVASDSDEIFVFRVTAMDACRGCWWLAYEVDGMPSLYRPEDIEAWDRLPPNRGHISTWVPRIGPNHDGCRCPPWLEWHPAMASIAQDSKIRRAARMRRLGLDRLEAAILRRHR